MLQTDQGANEGIKISYHIILEDFLYKIGIRGNPLAVKRLSFQMLTFYSQSISFGLEMKFFLVQEKKFQG